MRREGYVRKGRNGRYYAVVERPTATNGDRQRLSLGAFDSKPEAAKAIRKALDLMERGVTDPGRLTVAQFLTDEWLPGVRISLAPTTVALYETIVSAYILPTIGNVKLRAVTPKLLTKMYADLAANGGRKGKPLKPRTVRNVHRTIRTALENAVESSYLPWNPAASRATKKPRVEPSEHDVWDADELRVFLEAAASDRLAALWILLSSTGMRRAELCGLRWRDIDLDEAVVRIRRTIVQYGKVRVEKEPKTPTSRRTLTDIDPRAIVALRAHRKAQASERLAAGAAWNATTDRVFRDAVGNDLRPDVITRGMARIVKDTGLPTLTPHGLRHSYATAGLEGGVDVVYVSALLGHSSAAVTQSTYQHVRAAKLSEASKAISSALLGG